ncbi:hypothetical protein ULM_17400 [Legionella pneumophila]|nr:hypothetical protein ULM_17400 [Legionella pneumophila]
MFRRQLKIKKHGRKGVKFFRYGLDLLRDAALNGLSVYSPILSPYITLGFCAI